MGRRVPPSKKENTSLKEQLAAKNRALKIEASLEKVRVKAMAMRKSSELPGVALVLLKQVERLGITDMICSINIVNPKNKKFISYSAFNIEASVKKVTDQMPELDLKEIRFLRPVINRFKRGEKLFRLTLKGEALKEMLAIWKQSNFSGLKNKQVLGKPKVLYLSAARFDVLSSISITSIHPLSEDQMSILGRMAKTFGMCYTRFLDLKKAEAQTLEAQIEVALERIRARALAMHTSDELTEVAQVLRGQMGVLGQPELLASIVHLYPKNSETFDSWFAFRPPNQKEKKIIHGTARFRKDATALTRLWYKMYLSKEKEYSVKAEGKILKEWLKERNRVLPSINKSFGKLKPSFIQFYFCDFSGGSLILSSNGEPTEKAKVLLKRAASVFDLAYRRFLDLQKAEAQAREAQIEAALERVRARALAMRRSEELNQLIGLFFTELTKLELILTRCAFYLLEPDAKSSRWWIANAEAPSEPMNFLIPYHEHPPYMAWLKAWRKREQKWRFDLRGKIKRDWDKFLFSKTELVRLPDKVIEAMKAPEQVIIRASFNSFGSINLATLEPLSEGQLDILTRFAKVFEQTYTRFLDLQKAEAQAREAQIEVALERVRSRSMAMHNTEELWEVSSVVYEEFNKLGISEFESCGVHVVDEEKGTQEVYNFQIDGKQLARFQAPLKGDKVLDERYTAWKRHDPFIYQIVEGKALNKHIKFSSGQGLELGPFGSWTEKSGFPDPVHFHFGVFSKGYLHIIAGEELSKEQKTILLRFAKVFEQTYTRFLDLQKAEAQAREAQIEAALERVRSRSLAMHSSDELMEVVDNIFKGLEQLGYSPAACSIFTLNHKTEIMDCWSSIPTKEGTSVYNYALPFYDHPLINALLQHHKESKPYFVYHLIGDEKISFDDHFFKYFKFPDMEASMRAIEELYGNCVLMENGGIVAWAPKPMDEADISILQRFTKVVDLTYHRFLDLQKAEAQAREAEIQLALERIRARAMAMQSSEELREVVQIMYSQVGKLEIAKWGCLLLIFDKAKEHIQGWFSEIVNAQYAKPFDFENKDHEVIRKWWDFWESDEEIMSIHQRDEVKHEFARYLFTKTGMKNLPEDVKSIMMNEPEVYFEYVNMAHGIIQFVDIEPFPSQSIPVLKRITRAFEQTYTRFLDLKKAEAQAREAQIEVSLERVRAKTMGMHSSNELLEIVDLLYAELSHLDIELARVVLLTVNPETLGMYWWMASPEKEIKTHGFLVPPNDLPMTLSMVEAWKKKRSDWSYHLEGRDKKKYDKTLFSKSELSQLPEEVKMAMSSARQMHISGYCNNFGLLTTSTLEPLSSTNAVLLTRFGQVFEQTYTRFLDLQKAEAQAREAEIELALERVRARTMAMHKSDELPEVARVIFQQFKELNLKPLTANIKILHEEEGYFDLSTTAFQGDTETYQFKMPLEGHPFQNVLSKSEPYFRFVLKGKKEVKAMHERFFKLTGHQFFQPPTPLEYHEHLDARNKYGLLGIDCAEPIGDEAKRILTQFSKVFEQTYTRFLDLQKAEAQAREAQIEVSLERVRARTMAMHKSDELFEVAVVLYKELHSLGVTSFLNCGYVEVDEQNKIQHGWLTGPDGSTMEGFSLPLVGEPIFDARYKSWKQREPFFCQVVGGSELKRHLEFAMPQIGSKQVEEVVKNRFQDPTIFYSGNFPQGYLHIISGTPLTVEEESLFTRFTRVFEMTYKRFIDLQKAEAQAREAQIETALERIRSRTMAMHKSDELAVVASLLFQQIGELGIRVWTAGFNVWLNNDTAYQDWITSPTGGFIEPYVVDATQFSVFIEVREAKQRGDEFFVQYVGGETIQAMYAQLSKFAPNQFAIMLEHGFEFPKEQYDHFVFGSTVSLMFITFEPIPEAHDIFKRFGKVFQQTYTRFLDLQKAEAQAREAQIEVALERVRAKMMAMHKTEELHEVLGTIFTQLQFLGLDAPGSSLIIYNDDLAAEHWMIGFSDSEFPESYKIPYVEHSYFTDLLHAWQAGIPFQELFFEGDRKLQYADWCLEYSDFKRMPPEFKKEMKNPARMVISDAFNKYGMIEILGPNSLSEENITILKRFSKVFEQTYTRFLDLQKAEAQAKEARIEAALERVRSRTMAMHNSDEFREVVFDFFEQLHPFGFAKWGFQLRIASEDRSGFYAWLSTPAQRVLPERYVIPTLDHWALAKYWSVFEQQLAYTTIEVKGDDKRRLDLLLFEKSDLKNLPEDVKKNILAYDYVQFSVASMRYGLLEAIDVEPIPEEGISILKRFAKVFEQTYTRFLDLQKAEAQAREAQIEAALERVRSKSMAMHRSDELNSVLSTMFAELTSLSFDLARCVIWIYNLDDKSVRWYAANPEAEIESYHIPFTNYKVITDYWKAWEERIPRMYYDLSGDLKKGMDEYIFHHTEMASMPAEVKEGMKAPPQVHIYNTFNDFGVLFVPATEPQPDEIYSILERFGNVFNQSYRRFQDIQKAEAQAREAEIELGLERVRARAMAMQSSEELNELIGTVFTELTKLDLTLTRATIMIYEGNEKGVRWWMANSEAPSMPMNFFVDYADMPFFNEYLKAWSARIFKWQYTLEGEDKVKTDDFLFNHTELSGLPEFVIAGMRAPDRVFLNVSFNNFGNLTLASLDQLSNQQSDILLRFAKVFDLTYTRFNDLQKAEAQTREAQIEIALERIRARAMAMHSSDELIAVADVLREQMGLLGQPELEVSAVHLYTDGADTFESWYAFRPAGLSEGKIVSRATRFKISTSAVAKEWLALYHSDQSEYTTSAGGEKLTEWFRELGRNASEITQYWGDAPPSIQYFHFCDFSGGTLAIVSTQPPSEESKNLLRRSAAVFDLAYRRFVDLKKAEAQAREAQIEVALERIRARALAMHASTDLEDVANVLREQMRLLNQPELEGCVVELYEADPQSIESWHAFRPPTGKEGKLITGVAHFSKDSCELIREMIDMYHSGKKQYTIEASGKKLQEWTSILMQTVPEVAEYFAEDASIPEAMYYHCSDFSGGTLLVSSREKTSPEVMSLQARAASVFDLAYRRFLDLKKAEAQTREAQIEASLERVRSRTMAMQQSSELNIILAKVFEELSSLELQFERCVIWIYNPEDRSVRWWAANPEAESGAESYFISNQDHRVYHEYWKAWEERRTKYLYILEGENMVSWCDVLFYETELGKLPEEVQVAMRKPDRVYLYNTFNDFGVLFLACLGPLSDDKFSILERFGKVFDQSYTRFNDIRQAEARAKEAIRQASLDRVRGEIASMRSTEDLQRITPLVWKELTSLGVPFIRCGVFIVDESLETVQTYLSAPDGHSLGVLNLQINTSEFTNNIVEHWRRGQIYKEHWNQEQFVRFMHAMIELGQVKETSSYQGSENPPDSLYLHFINFKQGMLYVGNSEPLTTGMIDLVKTLADSFSIAYSRYEDFRQLENAKSRIETTLSELKSTQSQLIQSEKMASLGELTAGIAHEIQNPLNFVNNFSEVTNELLEEMNEEIALGHTAEAKAIADDIRQNLEKVLHHGKRADAIVKGMLQHSRSSSGVKEPTDINALADEYLRLAYHGLRARDKSFNATTKTNFDESLGMVEVIPQDIGRVVLNLITNAFYAVGDKKRQQPEGYEPTVAVGTTKENGYVLIRVKDNGNGIPHKVLDKIFQPFFTTKPTGQGTGLGLSLSYDIVKAHGGEIAVETKAGEGSEFVISIPIV